MRTVIFDMELDMNTYVTIFLSLIMFVLAINVIIRSELLGDER
jgi:putative ABC-2 transporter, permease protein